MTIVISLSVIINSILSLYFILADKPFLFLGNFGWVILGIKMLDAFKKRGK